MTGNDVPLSTCPTAQPWRKPWGWTRFSMPAFAASRLHKARTYGSHNGSPRSVQNKGRRAVSPSFRRTSNHRSIASAASAGSGAVRGPHKGKLGYYDDDDLGSERRPGKAIVYLGEPFESDYIVIRRADLEKVTAKNIDLERWKRKYPWLARQLGLP